ncbi:MAG: ammonium transporter [Pseudomonadota bacterium]
MKRSSLLLFLLIGFCVYVGLMPTSAPLKVGGPINPADVAWMLTATSFVLFMTPGLAFFYGGMVSPKNVISTMVQSFISMGIISLIWVIVGFSLAFGDSLGGLIGNPLTFFMLKGVSGATHPDLSPTIPLILFAMFQLKFAVITPALVTGAIAERIKFKSYIMFISLFILFIYAPLAHWTWHPSGFLRTMGLLDFAGGTVVHMSAGIGALAGVILLGRRKSHGTTTHAPANIPYVILGTGMLWFGWFGFNAGSALGANEQAALALATTNSAAASAAIAWVLFDVYRGQKPNAVGACIGAVVGLVAITPAAGYVSIGASIFIGAIASIVSACVVVLKSKTKIDDTLDVFPCHGVGGIMGMLLTGIFAKDVGLIFGPTKTFLTHCLGLGYVAAFSFVGSLLIFKFVDLTMGLRVSDEEEDIGLDLSQHGESLVDVPPRTAPIDLKSTPKYVPVHLKESHT